MWSLENLWKEVIFLKLFYLVDIIRRLLLINRANLPKSFGKKEESEDRLAANPAFILLFRKYLPLARPRHEQFHAKLPLNNQFFLLSRLDGESNFIHSLC